MTDSLIVHAVMYRNYQLGTLCNSGAFGLPEHFSAITENVTCPACRDKLDGGTSPADWWKAEALAVLAQWYKVFEALGKPGQLGESLAAASLAEVQRLRAAANRNELATRIRDLADWHETKACKARTFPGDDTARLPLMLAKAEVHADAAERLREILGGSR